MYDTTVFRADIAVKDIADRHDRGAFHLGAHPVRVDHKPAIDRHVDARDRHLSVIAHRNVGNGCDIGQKTAVHRDAATLPRGQLLTPTALLRHQVEDTAQPPRIDRIDVERGAVIRIIDAQRRQVDMP